MTGDDTMLGGCEKGNMPLSDLIIIRLEPIHNSVPLPPPIHEAIGRIFQHNLVAFLDVDLLGVNGSVSYVGNKQHTVLSVTFWRKEGIFSASIGNSSNSDKSSTAFSKSLRKVLSVSVKVSYYQILRTYRWLSSYNSFSFPFSR